MPGKRYHLAPFRFDVTPPIGHSICGGWIEPAKKIEDALEAIGFILLGAGAPIVICALDWTGLLNGSHAEWRQVLAKAAGTTPDRVAIQCVHQHSAPFVCMESQRIAEGHEGVEGIVQADFYHLCLERARKAVEAASTRARSVTHIAHGEACVEKVASNRRVFRDERGDVIANRHSSEKNPDIRALPEGLIDPWLKTVAFYDGDKKLAACHYYATHPMSHYKDGVISSDFVGMARKRRQDEEPDCPHIYFTGCSGNIAAGKYNDGTPEMRPILAQRIYEGMVRSEQNLKPVPIESVSWKTAEISPRPLKTLTEKFLSDAVSNRENPLVERNRGCLMLAWVRRAVQKLPVPLSLLEINDVSILHLPAECFVEYQLRAQQLAPSRFVAVAAYGDGGLWYIPVKEEYAHGGYEVSVAICDPEIDSVLTNEIRSLLTSAPRR